MELEKWEQTLHECPWRPTKGAAPCAVKVACTVLNGGDEETYRKATRLVPTQLECDNYSATRQPDSTITAPVCACHLVSYTDTYSRYMSNSYKLSGRCKLRSPAVSGEACLRKPPAGVTGSHRCTALPSSCIMRGSVHGCALGQSMARRRVSHEILSRGNASCAGLAGARDRSARASWRPMSHVRPPARTAGHAAAAIPWLPWTPVSSRRGPEETTVWPRHIACTFSAR